MHSQAYEASLALLIGNFSVSALADLNNPVTQFMNFGTSRIYYWLILAWSNWCLSSTKRREAKQSSKISFLKFKTLICSGRSARSWMVWPPKLIFKWVSKGSFTWEVDVRTSFRVFTGSSGKISGTCDSLSGLSGRSVSDAVDSLSILCMVTPLKSTLKIWFRYYCIISQWMVKLPKSTWKIGLVTATSLYEQ